MLNSLNLFGYAVIKLHHNKYFHTTRYITSHPDGYFNLYYTIPQHSQASNTQPHYGVLYYHIIHGLHNIL